MLIMLVSFLGGIWYNLDLMGGTLKAIANALLFVHSVRVAQFTLIGNYSEVPSHLIWVVLYAIVIFVIAIIVFKKKMNSENL